MAIVKIESVTTRPRGQSSKNQAEANRIYVEPTRTILLDASKQLKWHAVPQFEIKSKDGRQLSERRTDNNQPDKSCCKARGPPLLQDVCLITISTTSCSCQESAFNMTKPRVVRDHQHVE